MVNVTNTGISLSTTSQLSAGQKILIAAAMRAHEPAAADPDLISSARLPKGHKQYDLLTYARLAQADNLTEGVDYTSVQQLFANLMTVDPSEYGIIVTISKRAMDRQPEDLQRMAGELQGVSIRQRHATRVIALYDGFSKIVGSAGTTLDITHMRGSTAFLQTDNDSEFGPAPMPYKYAAHAENISDIVADITQGSAASVTRTAATSTPEGGVPAAVLKAWWRGSDRAYGTQVFHSGYMTRDSLDDVKGGLFATNALFTVTERDNDRATEVDASHRLTEFGLFRATGEVERADPHGVEMFFDASSTV